MLPSVTNNQPTGTRVTNNQSTGTRNYYFGPVTQINLSQSRPPSGITVPPISEIERLVHHRANEVRLAAQQLTAQVISQVTHHDHIGNFIAPTTIDDH